MNQVTEVRQSHRWEEAGLGQAPYRLVTCISLATPSLAEANPEGYMNQMREASQAAKHFGVYLGSCNYCLASLIHNYVVRDAGGKHFVIGCDCVEHCGDRLLIDEVKQSEKKRLRAMKAERDRAAFEAQQAAERTRNGGKTDSEIRCDEYQARMREEQQRQREAALKDNAWLITFLEGVSPSPFVEDMIDRLQRYSIDDLSGKQQEVLCDIYCRGFRGWEKDARRSEFFSHTD
jgi:hypothetical protein